MIGKNAAARADYDKAVSTVKSKEAQVANSEAAIGRRRKSTSRSPKPISLIPALQRPLTHDLRRWFRKARLSTRSKARRRSLFSANPDTMTVEAGHFGSGCYSGSRRNAAYFTISGQNLKRYDATLEKIEPAPDSIVSDKSFTTTAVSGIEFATASAIYYKGIFSVPNPDGLPRTYMTTVHILLAKAKDALIAPRPLSRTRVNREGHGSRGDKRQQDRRTHGRNRHWSTRSTPKSVSGSNEGTKSSLIIRLVLLPRTVSDMSDTPLLSLKGVSTVSVR